MIQVAPCVPANITVALLYGGKSTEREISIKSAESVNLGLKDCGFKVEMIDTGESGYISALEALKPDVVFNCLHGRGGEDGCVQGVCMELGLPFTGSGVLASALAMDKARAKVFYESSNLNTPASISVSADKRLDYEEASAKLGKKVVIKPACEGSAFGVFIVEDEQAYKHAIDEAFKLDNVVVIEQFISGTEVTVAVLGNDELVALPVLEIIPHGDFYDFESKYAQGGSEHICPARLSEEVTQKCQDISIAAHRILGCRGVSRSDLIIDENDIPWILETNTIPGMTSTSLIPDAARCVGLEFADLCKLIVELALEDSVR